MEIKLITETCHFGKKNALYTHSYIAQIRSFYYPTGVHIGFSDINWTTLKQKPPISMKEKRTVYIPYTV